MCVPCLEKAARIMKEMGREWVKGERRKDG